MDSPRILHLRATRIQTELYYVLNIYSPLVSPLAGTERVCESFIRVTSGKGKAKAKNDANRAAARCSPTRNSRSHGAAGTIAALDGQPRPTSYVHLPISSPPANTLTNNP